MSDEESPVDRPVESGAVRTGARGQDPGGWGFSMANFEPLMTALFDAVEAKSVLEVGAYAGDLTEVLHRWCEANGATLAAVDPVPQPALRELAERAPAIALIESTGAEALASAELPDVAVIDSDHNYHTLSAELAAIAERATNESFPLLIFHDVGWPHARRDSFYAPERIPTDERGEIAANATLFPGEPGLAAGGLRFPWAAVREGGPRNGVLTAIEDFVGGQSGLRHAVVPGFFGMGMVWSERHRQAERIAALAEAWTANPTLGSLEANRVFNLAARHDAQAKFEYLEVEYRALEARFHSLEDDYHRLADRYRGNLELLKELQSSRALTLADQVGAIRGGDRPSWRERIHGALRDNG